MIRLCAICEKPLEEGKNTSVLDENSEETGEAVHLYCYQNAVRVLQIDEMVEQISRQNNELTDLRFTVKELQEKAEDLVNISSIITYLEALKEQQEITRGRATKGSDYQRIAAFRANDAEDLLLRLKKLNPKSSTIIPD